MRPLPSLLLLSSALGLAAPAPAPDGPARDNPKLISVDFRGSLRDALRTIASEGGLNLVVTGALEQPAQVYLKNVTAEEALSTVAEAYSLKMQHQGSIYTLRPLKADEMESPKTELRIEVPPDGQQVENHLREKFRNQQSEKDLVQTGSLTVKEDEVVRNAVSYGGSITVEGVVGGNVVAFGGSVHLGPKAVVKGDVVAFGGQVVKEPGALVSGSTTSFGGTNWSRALSSTLLDKFKHGPDSASDKADDQTGATRDSDKKTLQAHRTDDDDSESHFSGFGWFLLRFAVMFGLGALFMVFVPQRMKVIETELKAAPMQSLVTGFIGMIALLPLLILLSVTVIGIPVAVALVVLIPLGMAMGFVAIATEIGTRFPRGRGRRLAQAPILALGLLVLLGLGKLPVLGPVLMLLAAWVSLGALIRTRFGGTRKSGLPEPFGDPLAPGPT